MKRKVNIMEMIMKMKIMYIGNDNGNDNGNSENNVYWCFGEASEYKGWVIKLVLTTPVKF